MQTQVSIILDDQFESQLIRNQFREKLNEKLKLFLDECLVYNVREIILVGERHCGKLRLLERLSRNIYLNPGTKYDNPMPTAMKTIFYNHDYVTGILTKVPGYFGDSIPDYMTKHVRGIICCYDISNRSSFENLELWIERLKSKLNPQMEYEMILVGTKSDLPSRQVSYQEALEMSTKHQMKLFFETSSKIGENVNEMFYELLKLLQRFEEIKGETQNKPKLESESGNWCNIV